MSTKMIIHSKPLDKQWLYHISETEWLEQNSVTIFTHATKKHNEDIIKLLSFQTSKDKICRKKLQSELQIPIKVNIRTQRKSFLKKKNDLQLVKRQ